MQTVFVRKSEVPEYLQSSPVLANWDDAIEAGAVEIPINVLKPNSGVSSDADLKYMLETLRYWLVEDMPYTVFDYVSENPTDPVFSILEEFREQMRDVRCLLSWHLDVENFMPSLCRPHMAIQADSVNCLKYLFEHSRFQLTTNLTATAARVSLSCLKYLHDQGCPWDCRTVHNSAAAGQVDCLEYALFHGCEGSRHVMQIAAQNGHVHILKRFAELHMDVHKAIEVAAAGGHLECLKYLHSLGPNQAQKATMHAAQNGKLECLQFLHEHGYKWDASVTWMAAANGQLECLKYAIEHGCVCRNNAFTYAANNGVRDYLSSRGYNYT